MRVGIIFGGSICGQNPYSAVYLSLFGLRIAHFPLSAGRFESDRGHVYAVGLGSPRFFRSILLALCFKSIPGVVLMEAYHRDFWS